MIRLINLFLVLVLVQTSFLSSANATQMHWVDRMDRWLTEAVDECGWNGASDVGTFDVKKVSFLSALHEIKTKDRFCVKSHLYSKSREHAIEMFEDHIENFEETRRCLEENMVEFYQKEMKKVIRDPKNIAVIANVHSGEVELSEYCTYFDFYVFRPDGTLLKWSFNYTD